MTEGGDVVDVLVICPSRGRPSNVAALLAAWQETATEARLVVCVDDDDPTLDEYRNVVSGDVELVIGERRRLVAWCNRIAYQLRHQFDAIGIIGDDVRPRTHQWDRLLTDALEPMGIVYGNDLHQGEALPTHPILDAEIVRRLGYLAPPELVHLYPDNVWKAWGEALGTLTYRDDVIVEHMHPHAGKADMDELYAESNSRDAYRRDKAAFDTYMTERFTADVERLR